MYRYTFKKKEYRYLKKTIYKKKIKFLSFQIIKCIYYFPVKCICVIFLYGLRSLLIYALFLMLCRNQETEA